MMRLFYLFCLMSVSGAVTVTVNLSKLLPINEVKQSTAPIWTSTGFSPPQDNPGWYKTSEMQQNVAMIAALPYNPFDFQLRIHWLLNLVTVRTKFPMIVYDFTSLDEVVQLLYTHKLRIGFELMGNPSNHFTDFEDSRQIRQWYKLIYQIVQRYKKYSAGWNYESWNEPDHKDFGGLNMTEQGYYNYFDATEKGIHDADPEAKFGGPGASCRQNGFSKLCWGLLSHVTGGKNYFTGQNTTRLDFFSFHRKGGKRGQPGFANELFIEELHTINYLRENYPSLINVTIYNDEADPVTGWDDPRSFRSDTRYPAMVLKLLGSHLTGGHDQLTNFRMLSNDNAFLSFTPNYFTQRTMFARFQVNDTSEPFSVLIRKPIYEGLAMMSQMRGAFQILPSSFNGIIASQTNDLTCITIWTGNDTSVYAGGPVEIVLQYPPNLIGSWYTIRRISDKLTTTNIWESLGSPGNLTQSDIEKLFNLNPIEATTPQKLTSSTLHIFLPVPSVNQFMFCTHDSNSNAPNDPQFLNITLNAVLITWADQEVDDCFFSYELEFRKTSSESFASVTRGVILTRAYQFSRSDGVIGQYRVRSRTLANSYSAYSQIAEYN